MGKNEELRLYIGDKRIPKNGYPIMILSIRQDESEKTYRITREYYFFTYDYVALKNYKDFAVTEQVGKNDELLTDSKIQYKSCLMEQLENMARGHMHELAAAEGILDMQTQTLKIKGKDDDGFAASINGILFSIMRDAENEKAIKAMFNRTKNSELKKLIQDAHGVSSKIIVENG
ncbi:MAG: hypothetical protein AABZ39_11035 [Spirochaetota bacterium]